MTMAKQIVTLDIHDNSIRLLVTQGERIKKWANVPLESGLVSSGVVLKEEEVASKIKQLLKDQKIGAKKVVVGLSGLHCLSRLISFPKLPQDMLTEAVMREAKRVLPVALEQLYISWQTIPEQEGKTTIYLVAIPRKTADAMVQMLRQANLKPYLMDLRPLALANVTKESRAVILNIESTELDIIIMVDGVPQPIRTVLLPNHSLPWQEKLPMIKDEADRTIRFYNSHYQDKPLLPNTPVFISGELANEPDIAQSLSEGLGYTVSQLPPSFECPEGLDPSYYMVNIGLVLKELPSSSKSLTASININALPTSYQTKTTSWVKVVTLPIILAAGAAIAPFWMLVQDGSTDIAAAQGQLNVTNQFLIEKQQERQQLENDIAELEQILAEAETSRDDIMAALESLDSQSEAVNHDLQAVTRVLPINVRLGRISRMSNTLTISGTSPSEIGILEYAQNLKDSGRFDEVTIALLRRVEDTDSEEESMDFNLILTIGGSY